jgi:transcriptional regulator with XRE-family HTH domain
VNDIPYGLGNRIRYYRLLRGWTQQRAARQMHIDAANLSRIESGRADPSIRVLRRIASYLVVTCGELLD